ncbi:hypothetical protein D3C87_127320 [compost metagenome]
MGYKNVCIGCRKSFSAGNDLANFKKRKCPNCGIEMNFFDHKFRPPSMNDDKKWKLIEFLALHGFVFQKVYKNIGNGILLKVKYPLTMEEAKLFVKEFKDQGLDK